MFVGIEFVSMLLRFQKLHFAKIVPYSVEFQCKFLRLHVDLQTFPPIAMALLLH